MIKFFDGAFGTYYSTLVRDAGPCEEANITNPKMVLKIHQEYIKAGVDYIKTNTFNANKTVYEEPGKVQEIIREGYKIALEATRGTDVQVFADIGYIGEDDPDEASKMYWEIAKSFIDLGAKNFLFETLCEYEVIEGVIEFIKKEVPDAVVVVSFAVAQDGYSRKGLYYKSLLARAEDNELVDIIGLNCACGPTHLLKLAKDLPKTKKPLSIMPNSGYPSSSYGRTVFEDNAEYFAQKLKEIHELGVDILGGCCGTTPKHISLAIKCIKSEDEVKKEKTTFTYSPKERGAKLPLKKLAVELDPPHNSDCSFILDAVDILKDCGVSTITVADSPLAKARANSIMTSGKIKREKNIDVLPHLTCRDKNHIAIKGSMIGASFDGINQILIITGDPIVFDSYKKTGVFNFNSIELIAYIESLNREIFGGSFKIGGAINVNAVNFDAEIKRCAKKIASGATFLLSQPIFTELAIKNFIRAKEELKCELYAGILPIASYRNGIFLNNEVAGIDIPSKLLADLKDKELEEVYDVSLAFSQDIIKQVYDAADGFYLMTPIKKVELVCHLIKRCFDV